MDQLERKTMVVNVIRTLEDEMAALKYCEYDGVKPSLEREEELNNLRTHWNTARTVLVIICENELKGSA